MARNLAPLLSTGKDNWQTPPEIFGPLDKEFRFTIDAAADESNRLLARYMGPGETSVAEDALTVPWVKERAFLNPPYSKVKAFVEKASEERNNSTTTAMLIPARTDTRWFHEHIWDRRYFVSYPNVEIRFLKGRIKFLDAGRPSGPAPFPSMIVIFRP